MTKEQIIEAIKRKRIKFILFLLLTFIPITVAILAGVFFYYNTLTLFLSAVVLVMALFLAATSYPRLKAPLVIREAEGVIKKCHIEKFERNTMKTSSYSLIRKPYSNYFEDTYALSLFIQTSKKTVMKRIKNLSFAVCDYYKVGDRALLISGCPLPFSLNTLDKRNLNPLSCDFVN